jgi:hypothetical protein
MSYLEEIVAAPVWKTETTSVGIRCADQATLFVCKSCHYLRRQAAVARSVIVGSQTEGHGVYLFVYVYIIKCIYLSEGQSGMMSKGTRDSAIPH